MTTEMTNIWNYKCIVFRFLQDTLRYTGSKSETYELIWIVYFRIDRCIFVWLLLYQRQGAEKPEF